MRMFSAPFGARSHGMIWNANRPNDNRHFQLGPKIRIGGSIGHAAQKLKIGAGKVLSNKYVDMGLSLLPGVGPGIAAAANAAGHVLDTSGGGIHSVGDVAHIAKDAGSVYLGSKALGAAKGAVSKSGILSTAKKLVTGGGSDGKGNFGAAGDLAGHFTGGGGGDRSGLVDKLLLGAGIASSAADRKRQQDMQDRASHYATDSYDSRAGLRERGLSGAMNNTAPNLTDTYEDPGNPYTRRPVAAPALGTRMPVRRLSY